MQNWIPFTKCAVRPALLSSRAAMKHEHKRGRPARTSATGFSESRATTNVSVRMTDEELEALDSHVQERHLEGATRAGLIREAMEKHGLFKIVRKTKQERRDDRA